MLDAPLSSRFRGVLCDGLFVSPHSSDYAVGEVAFVGASDFSAGLAFDLLAGEVILSCFVVVLLADGGYVEDGVDATVASVCDGCLCSRAGGLTARRPFSEGEPLGRRTRRLPGISTRAYSVCSVWMVPGGSD